MRVAVYLRASSDKQVEASIPAQRKAVQEFCKRQGHSIVAEYRDEGISGDSFERRLGFRSLLADAAAGTFERVVAWDQDRIGRHDSLKSGAVLEPLREHGISIETLGQGVIDFDTFGGRVVFGVMQEAKHEFLRGLSRNTVRGQTAKAEAADGYHGSPPVYGYRRETELRGSRRFTRLVIDESEGAIVRRMFADYLAPQASFNIVAEGLNRDRIPLPVQRSKSRKRQHWEADTVRFILKNPVYTGRIVYGRRLTAKYSHRTAGGVADIKRGRALPKPEPIIRHAPDIVPPLVSDADFEAVQALVGQRRHARRKPGTVSLLSGILRCNDCGLRFVAERGGYRCVSNKRTSKPGRCSGHRIPEAPIVEAIGELLAKHLATPGGVSLVRKNLERILAVRAGSRADEIPALRKRLASLEAKIETGLATLLEMPKGLSRDFARKLDEARQERDAVSASLAGLESTDRADTKSLSATARRLAEQGRECAKALAGGDTGAANHCLRQMGIEVLIRGNNTGNRTAEVLIPAPRHLLSTSARDQPVPLCSLRVSLSPPKPQVFQPGNRLAAAKNRRARSGC